MVGARALSRKKKDKTNKDRTKSNNGNGNVGGAMRTTTGGRTGKGGSIGYANRLSENEPAMMSGGSLRDSAV
jgi:pectate lyase